MTWFGASWGAPLNEECPRQATPAGELCLRCEEPIESWTGLSSDTLRRRCRAGEIKGAQLDGKTWYIPEHSVAGIGRQRAPKVSQPPSGGA